MRNGKVGYVLLAIAACILMASCVTARKFDDQKALTDKYRAEKEQCLENQERLTGENEQLANRNKQLEKDNRYLQDDTTSTGIRYRKLKRLNNDVNAMYETLLSQNKEMVNSSAKEREALSQSLTQKELELSRKEDELNRLASSLKTKEDALDAKNKDIGELTTGLNEREQRINELEGLIARKDSSVKQLKASITNALKGFSSDELTVEEKNGRIYISLSEKLLFKSGSYTIDKKGEEALTKLAEVLKKQEKIEINVEGHTDNVPYKSSSGQIRDNWDLSVLRATTIAKILIQDNGMSSDRVIPSGRGDQLPVASNEDKEGRSKNRRTEIIVTPDLNELFKILETN